MESADLIVAAIPAFTIGAAALWWLNRRPPAPVVNANAINEKSLPISQTTWPANALPVLGADQIIATTGMAPLLLEVRKMSGLTDATWQTYVDPVIQSVTEMIQQLPGSEAHHHAQPGGLFIHTVETLHYAAKLRQGRILPPGADIETQGKTQHLWTVAILIAALLHDIGKVVSDVRITLYSEKNPAGTLWQALMGSMADAKASAYVVDFPRATERDYRAHQRIGIQLIQRLVSTEARIWLSSDPVLLEHLLGYLAGESKGPISEIVREAEAESVRRNLATGTRVRFGASKAIPLIELLMHALRTMLNEGGRLPLNRPGAAGFCDGVDIWFAAARLANEVRDWLRKSYPDEPVPGETMNDRLFDTWQEYQACHVNPSTNGAIWAARIEFSKGQPAIHLGALLRFPLQLLYPEPSLYPPALDGRIVSSEEMAIQTEGISPTTQTLAQPAVSEMPDPSTGAVHPQQPGTGAAIQVGADVVPGKVQRELAQSGHLTPPMVKHGPSAEEMSADPLPRLPNIQNLSGAIKKGTQKPPQAASAPVSVATPTVAYLDDEDAAGIGNPLMVGRSIPAPAPPEPPRFNGAVVPHVSLPTPTLSDKRTGKSGKKGTGPSEEALRFMGWLQQGIADGSLPYNTTTALVHFVRTNLRDKEETMMLLVSPVVFRRFAESYGDIDSGDDAKADPDTSPGKLGMGIQMAFTRAGWHLPAARGRNVHRFQVIRRGDSGGSLLNGFLVIEPERFVQPVPPPNERLRYWSQSVAAGEKAK